MKEDLNLLVLSSGSGYFFCSCSVINAMSVGPTTILLYVYSLSQFIKESV